MGDRFIIGVEVEKIGVGVEEVIGESIQMRMIQLRLRDIITEF